MSLRVLVVASGLRGVAGHNLGYTRAVRGAFEARGAEVTVFAHRHLARELQGEGYLPVFSVGAYEFPPGNGPWADLTYQYAQARIYADELRHALRDRSFDLVFLHTVADFELLAWARHLRWHGLDARLAVLFRQTPRWATLPRWKRYLHPYHRLRPSQLRALRRRLGDRLAVLTDTDVLSRDYALVAGGPVTTLPLPLAPLALEPITPLPPAPPTLGYLGDSRATKGFPFLPGLAEGLLAEAGRAVKLDFHSVTNEYDTTVSPATHALEALAARHPERLHLSRGGLTDAQYFALLRGSHVVVLPYDSHHFDDGSSNVFTESMACGRPVVVPRGSWMDGEMRRLPRPAGVTFERRDPASLLAACRDALDRWPELAAGAAEASVVFQRFHNAGNLVDVLLRACGLGAAAAAPEAPARLLQT